MHSHRSGPVKERILRTSCDALIIKSEKVISEIVKKARERRPLGSRWLKSSGKLNWGRGFRKLF